jgi:hypothetical protein
MDDIVAAKMRLLADRLLQPKEQHYSAQEGRSLYTRWMLRAAKGQEGFDPLSSRTVSEYVSRTSAIRGRFCQARDRAMLERGVAMLGKNANELATPTRICEVSNYLTSSCPLRLPQPSCPRPVRVSARAGR